MWLYCLLCCVSLALQVTDQVEECIFCITVYCRFVVWIIDSKELFVIEASAAAGRHSL
jgi:hypothetical protein